MTLDINATKTRQVFFSKVPNLRLVRVPQNEESFGQGNRVRELNPALAYEFEDGYLVVDDELRARDGRFFDKYPEAPEAAGNPESRFDGEDKAPAEEWLRVHQLKDVPLRGFVEVDQIAPDASGVLAEITDKVLAGDVAGLIELYEAEEKDHARQVVLDSASQAIAALEKREEGAPAA